MDKSTELFINTYKNLPILWDKSHPGYNFNRIKTKAYNELLDVLKYEDPSATVALVKKRIKNLRCLYHKYNKRQKEHPLIGLLKFIVNASVSFSFIS